MTDENAAVRRSQEYCMRLARRAAGNFYYGFMLLPRDRKLAMCALYAFLRASDDIVDSDNGEPEKQSGLATWRARFERALQMEPSATEALSPIFPALVHSVRAFQIPTQYLYEALDGVAMDLHPQEYRTFDQLYPYCYHVASTVGLCCLHIWGFDSEGGTAECMAESCGIAFQLTNIVRDVREDAERGRIYLPLEDLERFGVRPDSLAAHHPERGVRELLAFQCERAREFYERSAPLVERIAPVGRPMFRAMVDIYRGVLDAIAAAGYDVFARRVKLSPLRKASIAYSAWRGTRSR